MNLNVELLALQRENAALRQENKILHRELLQTRMERAVQDEHLSQRLVTELTDYFGDTVAPWFMCVLFHGGPPKQSGVPDRSPLSQITKTYQPVLESFGLPYFFEVRGTVVCLLNLTLPPDRDPEQLGTDIGAFLKTALGKRLRETGAETNVSHISMSHISRMEDGPRRLYRSAIGVSEHRTGLSDAVCTEYELPDPSLPGSERPLSLELIFWRQIQLSTPI